MASRLKEVAERHVALKPGPLPSLLYNLQRLFYFILFYFILFIFRKRGREGGREGEREGEREREKH